MIVSMLTSTQLGGFEPSNTKIAYKREDEPIQVKSYPLTETPALLAFTGEIIAELVPGSALVFRSKPNVLTNAISKGWLEAWKRDGFRKKPSEHRGEWARWAEIVESKHISITVQAFSDDPHYATDEAVLSAILSGKSTPSIARPGDPIENPWAKPESGNDMLTRAVKK
jgi:hypothetical protein